MEAKENQKPCENLNKQNEVSSSFRMAVEKVVNNFIESADESLEFPASLDKAQRNFVLSYICKFGLKTCDGRESNTRVIVCKNQESIIKLINEKLEVTNESRTMIHKLIEKNKDEADETGKSPEKKWPTKHVTHRGRFPFVSLQNSMTVPPKAIKRFINASLSIFSHRAEILQILKQTQLIIINGGSGSGKSTQIPQFILEDCYDLKKPCRIIVAQSRCISAITLSDRVSFERYEQLGTTTGYQIRLESCVSPNSSIVYCTSNDILRMLIARRQKDFFESISHLIIDDVHERNKYTDILLICIKDNLKNYPNLRVILMSATLNVDTFAKYFNNCPTVNIPGNLFTVEEFYLEDVLKIVGFNKDKQIAKELALQMSVGLTHCNGSFGNTEYDQLLLDSYNKTLIPPEISCPVSMEDIVDLNLIVKLVLNIHVNKPSDGAILVFLSGYDEIVRLAQLLHLELDSHTYQLLFIHESMETADQYKVFDSMPKGIRKIVLATNIAESSITVQDIIYVIDTGRENQKSFDVSNNISCLRPWISKASANQRKGRAGRMCEGHIFRLYSRDRFDNLISHTTPEILRCELSEICLQSLLLTLNGETVQEFIGKAIDPPSVVSIQYTIRILQQFGAIDNMQKLTQFGHYLADLPIDVRYTKMLMYSIIFKCLDPVLTIVSILSINDPFVLPVRLADRIACREIKHQLEDGSFSDHFVQLRFYQKWNEYVSETANKLTHNYCEQNYISGGTMECITSTRTKIIGYLRSAGFICLSGNFCDLNVNKHLWSVVKACLAAGSYPQIAHVFKSDGSVTTAIDPMLEIDSGSCLHNASLVKLTKETLATFPSSWFFFETKYLRGNNKMAKVCTLVSNMCLALTAGSGIRVIAEDETMVDLEVERFIRFTAEKTAGLLVEELRDMLDNLIQKYMQDIRGYQFTEHDEILITAIVKILENEDLASGFKIEHHGIGNRPRCITRKLNDFHESPPHKSLEKEIADLKISSSRDQVLRLRGDYRKYYLLKLESDEQIPRMLKMRVCNAAEEAEMPSSMVDTLFNEHQQRPKTDKLIIYSTRDQIVGVGVILSETLHHKRDDLAIMFVRDRRIYISELKKSHKRAELLEMKLRSPEFVWQEIPLDIGHNCVDQCLHRSLQ